MSDGITVMTDKVREFIDLCVGLGALTKIMSKEEIMNDDRLDDYFLRLNALRGEMTGAERRYITSVPAEIKQVILTFGLAALPDDVVQKLMEATDE